MKRITMALVVLLSAATLASAQTPQIPTLQVCNGTKAGGSGTVTLTKRAAAGIAAGNFTVSVTNTGCDPVNGNGFPSGSISMRFSLTDSSITSLTVTTIEQMTTTGKHTPTMFLNGRCMAQNNTVPCHYWLLLSDNKDPNVAGTADVISVLVVDKTGKRLTYGTGPLSSGDIDVVATSN